MSETAPQREVSPAPVPAVAPRRATRVDDAGAAAVRTRGLTKRFGQHLAVDGLDLDVPRGSVYGFLGPNGSGKTTTIRMLLGLVHPTAGSHDLLGQPMPAAAAAVLPRVGALVESPAFHPYLSARANLARLQAADAAPDASGREAPRRIDAALDRVGLLAAADRRYRVYSLGMRQRLGIAAALLRPRDLLVLDEPTNGLDPQGTREVRGLIRSLSRDGTTVFVSSHLLSEVEQICTHIGVMHAGRLVTQGAVDELRAGTAPRARIRTPDFDAAATVLAELGLTQIEPTAGGLSAQLGEVAPEAVVAGLVRGGARVTGFSVEASTLEDLYVSLTGEGFDVEY